MIYNILVDKLGIQPCSTVRDIVHTLIQGVPKGSLD